MALMHLDFKSDILKMAMSMDVILPERAALKKTGKMKVLYLLHGMSDDHTIWQRRTSVERYITVNNYNILTVMPNAHRSFYTDMSEGADYWRYVSEEIPGIIKTYFNISTKREDTFAAGLSMGGYGAMKLALRLPHKFAAGASLSGAVDPERFGRSFEGTETALEFRRTFGDLDNFSGSENDLFHLSSTLAKSGKPRPSIFQCCGTEDFLYADNIKFKKHLKKLKFDLHYEEGPGTHEWGYWDKQIQKVLQWLPLS
ncbi:MAG: esterase [Lentisphaerae bacterium GWF2_44_16]|nr:MAG: esterase [Lentisphaerae bacterium GWF2_44_16]